MTRFALLLASLTACSTRVAAPPEPSTASCHPKPIPACSESLTAVSVAALATAPPPTGAEVVVSGHLRQSDLVRCFTNRVCVDGHCSSTCGSPLVVSSTAEPTAAQREQLQTRGMVAPGDLGTQSTCEGDEHGLCCPYATSEEEVVVRGKVVAHHDAPEQWSIDVASVCRPSAG